MNPPELLEPRLPRRVAGVLSGTSADGIDVAIVCPEFVPDGARPGGLRVERLRQLGFSTEPFPAGLGERIRGVLERGARGLAEVSELHRDIGRAFGQAARAVNDRVGGGALDLVASHGQTVFHHDGRADSGPSTLQLGDGDQVAEGAGCAAVSDFRARDIAAGGEGAPLVGTVDDVLFRDAPRPLAILNLGGISNWTILGEEAGRPRAFDAGPAGALLDGLSREALDQPYDRGGAVALGGQVRPELLAHLMEHPFLDVEPPKSTGRDTFGVEWIADTLARAGSLSAADLLATGVRVVARSAVEALVRWGLASGEEGRARVLVAGGGGHNRALMAALEEELAACGVGSEMKGPRTRSSASLGVDPDAREALAFAALGARFSILEPSSAPSVTGAAPGRVLGKWSPAPPGAHRQASHLRPSGL